MNFEELGLSEEQIEVVTKVIQSETDKVRTDYSKQLNTLKDELKNYKPAEKSDAEKALEEKAQELEQKEKELANKEKSYTIKEKLSSKGLPSELAKYITVSDDIDKTIDEIGGTLSTYFLDGTFKPSGHSKNEGIDKNTFRKMSYSERAKLFDTNPELYKKLSQ
jgi:hypothetical protein